MVLSRTKTVLLWAAAAAAAAFLLATSLVLDEAFREERERLRAVQVGMTEARVVELLGPPDKVYSGSTAPRNYFVEGYSFKERQISSKVFIYLGVEAIAYVYFDDGDRVEEAFVGGS